MTLMYCHHKVHYCYRKKRSSFLAYSLACLSFNPRDSGSIPGTVGLRKLIDAGIHKMDFCE